MFDMSKDAMVTVVLGGKAYRSYAENGAGKERAIARYSFWGYDGRNKLFGSHKTNQRIVIDLEGEQVRAVFQIDDEGNATPYSGIFCLVWVEPGRLKDKTRALWINLNRGDYRLIWLVTYGVEDEAIIKLISFVFDNVVIFLMPQNPDDCIEPAIRTDAANWICTDDN